MEEKQWIGLSEEQFFRYKNWTTPSGYLCGTYASAVFLAYYQDYMDFKIIPSTIRKPRQKDNQLLVRHLQRYIQPHGLPTLSWQVAHGISRFTQRADTEYRARATMLGGWQRACKRINQGQPVILGILKVLGSTYGNHWVVAYAYSETRDGKRFFKVHDNWGSYNRVIPAHWVNGTVSFPSHENNVGIMLK